MANEREFPALRRRKRFLEQEMYTYDKYMRTGEGLDAKDQNRYALDAQDHNEECNEIEYVLRYFDRVGDGYRLSRIDWMLLIGLAVLAVGLAIVAVTR